MACAWLAVALVLSGCEERYLIPQRALEGTISLPHEKGRRVVALPAIREKDRAEVWVVDGKIVVDADPPRDGLVRARRTRVRAMTYIGGILLTFPAAAFLYVGGMLLADIPREDAQYNQCIRSGGWFCGSGFDSGLGGMLTGLGAATALVGALLMYFGTRRSAEIDSHRGNVLYVDGY
jgi:hypothetical protein